MPRGNASCSDIHHTLSSAIPESHARSHAASPYTHHPDQVPYPLSSTSQPRSPRTIQIASHSFPHRAPHSDQHSSLQLGRISPLTHPHFLSTYSLSYHQLS